MTTALNLDNSTIRTAAILAWQAGDNTADIARLLDLTEPEVERILLGVRDGRRVAGGQKVNREETGDELGVQLKIAEGVI